MQKGIIEQVDCAKRPDVRRVHYLPHHGVVRRNALATKLLVVFYASSRPSSDSPSLNDCRYLGTALTPTIFTVLLRFREKRLALVGDIEKAFLNVGAAEEDRDVLWISNSLKLLKLICENQVETVGTCAVVEDSESYAKTTVNHLHWRSLI